MIELKLALPYGNFINMLSQQNKEKLMNRTKVMQPERGGKESDSLCVAMFCTNETQSKTWLNT